MNDAVASGGRAPPPPAPLSGEPAPGERLLSLLVVLLIVAFICGIILDQDWITFADYFFALVLGAMIGVTDVFARYREAPLVTLGTPGAALRIIINSIASGIALWIIKENPFAAEGAGALVEPRALQIIVAGIGALAVLSVSLKITLGGSEISVGLATVIETLLGAADRNANSLSAAESARRVFKRLRGTDFDTVSKRVVPYCLELPQTLSAEDKKLLAEQITAIRENTALGDDEKCALIISALAKGLGWELLDAVLSNLPELKTAAPPTPPPADPRLAEVKAELEKGRV